MVCHFGFMQQSVTLSVFLIGNQDFIEKLEQNEAGSKRIGTITHYIWACSATSSFQDDLACIGLSHSSLMKYRTNYNETMGFAGKKKKTKHTLALSCMSLCTTAKSSLWPHCTIRKKQQQRANILNTTQIFCSQCVHSGQQYRP